MAEATPGTNYRGKRRLIQGVTKVTPGITYFGEIRNGRGDPRAQAQLMVGKLGTQV